MVTLLAMIFKIKINVWTKQQEQIIGMQRSPNKKEENKE